MLPISEGIDIFLDPLAFEPTLTKRGIDRELKKLRDAVAAQPALEFLPEESQTIGGFGRNDRFSYQQLYGGQGEVANRVLLEAGAASVVSQPRLSICAPTLVSSSPKPGSPSKQKTKARFRCACSISGAPLSRRCLRFTANSSY